MPSTRRDLLKFGALAAASAAMPVAVRAATPVAHAARPLDILILGGTGFTGPFQVQYALARGHRVTLFNRGRRPSPEWPGEVEQLHGDRDSGELGALRGRRWDVCIDNPTSLPSWVRDAGAVLKDAVGQYIFISTISVYADGARPGITEDAALAPYRGTDAMAETRKTLVADIEALYGPLKALSEAEAWRQFGQRVSIIRPGYIVGPRDESDRFTYWPLRIAQGGQVLVAIVVLTVAVIALGLDIRTVGDMGQMPDSLPAFSVPDIPWNWDTLRILLPVSATLAVVGLLESLMTAQIVEDMTDTPTDRRRESAGQGLANVVTGFFGGMAGCAMIGQSVINVSSGGRGRLSCLVAGVVLLVLVVYASEWVSLIPMAALVAVMIMVSIGTFHWKSFREIRTHPKTANLIMLGTVVVTVATRDLAMGVLTGVLLTALSFTRRVSALLAVTADDSVPGVRSYRVQGQVFFASAVQFANSFDYLHTPPKVSIDLRGAHFWDTSAVAALDRVVLKLRRHGAQVEVIGLNEASESLVEQLGTHRA